MLNIGTPEILVVLIIALVIVGQQRLPELGRTIGRGLREFRKVQDDVKDMVRMDPDLQEATSEFRRTASEMRTAADPRQIFKNEPHRPRRAPDAPADPAAGAVTPPADTASGNGSAGEPGTPEPEPTPASEPPATPLVPPPDPE